MKLDNKFFHYEVGDKKFHNNISAFQFLTELRRKTHSTDAKVKFVLDFDFMKNPKKYNWQTEPKESFSYYMEKTAMMLYEKHKNIMLGYSGGTDSHPIAKTFAKLGIPIHLFFWDLYPNGMLPPTNIRKKEWDYILKPNLIEWLKVNDKNKIMSINEVSFRGIDYNLEHFFSDNQFVGNYDLVTSCGSWNFPSSKILANGNKNKYNEIECSISGYEKPWIVLHDGWWCHTISDRVVAQSPLTSPFSSAFNDNYYWFYINDLVPELHIKITWNRIKVIEEIIVRDNLPLTNQQISEMQISTSKYYKEINDKTNYISLVESISLPGYKAHENNKFSMGPGRMIARFCDFRNPFDELTNNICKKEKFIVNDFWNNVVRKTIDESIFSNQKHLPTLSTNSIPVKKAYK